MTKKQITNGITKNNYSVSNMRSNITNTETGIVFLKKQLAM